MHYLDTDEYYRHRQTAIEQTIVRRAYFHGYPYVDNAVSGYSQDLWVNLLSPTDEESDYPIYMDNLAAILLNETTDDVLPPESRLVWEDLKEEPSKELARRLFNFGPSRPVGIDAFLDWCANILVDVALGGDGLLMMRYLPAVADIPPRIRFHYYPMESWDAEVDPDADEVLFYRIEYKFKQMAVRDGKEQVGVYWRRFDIHPDRIVRYVDQLQPWDMDDGIPPPAILPTADEFAGLRPPEMQVKQPGSQREHNLWAAESAAMRKLASTGEWICAPLLWNYQDVEDLRGLSELGLNRLQAIDQSNRLLTRWGDAAINAGDPPLAAVDLELPVEGGNEKSELTSDDVGPGAFFTATSILDKGGRMSYPDNQPQNYPHKEPLDRIREAVFQGAPNFSLNPEKISRFGELSGFAANQLNKSHNRRVRRLRSRLLTNGLLRAVGTAMRILDIKGALPAGVDADLPMKVEFTGPEYSPDERLKLSTMFAVLQDRNLPPEMLATILQDFITLHSQPKVVKALKEYQRDNDPMRKLAKLVGGAPADKGAGEVNVEDEAGMDKRVR